MIKRVIFPALTSVAILLILLTGLPSAYASNGSAPRAPQQLPATTAQAGAGQPTSRSQSRAPDMQSGKLKWRYQTGRAVNSSPAVVKGVIYFGSEDHYVYALSA